MNGKNILEKIHLLWIPVIGIALIVYGIYLFIDINTMEANGQTVRMKKIFELIYNFGGKYTMLAIFEIVGIVVLISGIKQLRGKL